MTERERLIELLKKSSNKVSEYIMENDTMDYIPTTDELYGVTADYLLENGVKCMPFIAMIERTTENGEFCKKKSEQKFNGRYCLVYEDKEKWGTPLIDICGTREYSTEEAENALKNIND